jgi:hypothetical protein
MAQDWSVHALVYFYSAGSYLPWAVLNWRLDLEFVDMTQEDIIRMAREAGLHRNQHNLASNPVKYRFSYDGYEENFERFAELVAAAEREACAKVVDHILKEGGGTWGDAIRARGQA